MCAIKDSKWGPDTEKEQRSLVTQLFSEQEFNERKGWKFKELEDKKIKDGFGEFSFPDQSCLIKDTLEFLNSHNLMLSDEIKVPTKQEERNKLCEMLRDYFTIKGYGKLVVEPQLAVKFDEKKVWLEAKLEKRVCEIRNRDNFIEINVPGDGDCFYHSVLMNIIYRARTEKDFDFSDCAKKIKEHLFSSSSSNEPFNKLAPEWFLTPLKIEEIFKLSPKLRTAMLTQRADESVQDEVRLVLETVAGGGELGAQGHIQNELDEDTESYFDQQWEVLKQKEDAKARAAEFNKLWPTHKKAWSEAYFKQHEMEGVFASAPQVRALEQALGIRVKTIAHGHINNYTVASKAHNEDVVYVRKSALHFNPICAVRAGDENNNDRKEAEILKESCPAELLEKMAAGNLAPKVSNAQPTGDPPVSRGGHLEPEAEKCPAALEESEANLLSRILRASAVDAGKKARDVYVDTEANASDGRLSVEINRIIEAATDGFATVIKEATSPKELEYLFHAINFQVEEIKIYLEEQSNKPPQKSGKDESQPDPRPGLGQPGG